MFTSDIILLYFWLQINRTYLIIFLNNKNLACVVPLKISVYNISFVFIFNHNNLSM